MAHSKSRSSNDRGSSSSSSESERTRQLLHPDELMKLSFGEYVLSMQREDPIKSSLALLRKWKDFKTGVIKIENKKTTNYEKNYLRNFVHSNVESENSELDNAILEQIIESSKKINY